MSVFSEANQPGFTSRAELLSTFDGDTAFVRELVLTFIERVPVLMGEIESGLSAGDRTAVSHAAHSLKGSLGYFDHGFNLANTSRIEQLTSADLADGADLLLHLHEGMGTLMRYLSEQFVTAQHFSTTDLGPAN